jgi:N-acetyl-anhydromuramyl-L-alanine amidase AmpD
MDGSISAAPAPKIIWRGTVNYTVGRGEFDAPLTIVDHISQGSMGSMDSHFKNPSSQASANFGVAKAGFIYQWVHTKNAAWANGIVQKPDRTNPLIREWADRGVWFNAPTISIEHEGLTGETMPEAQYQATLALHKYLIRSFKIPADPIHIFGHNSIDSVDRPFCPGKAFPWNRLLQDLKGVVTPPPPVEEQEIINGFVVRGEILRHWRKYNGLRTYGFPKSNEILWKRPEDGRNITIQGFERVVLGFDKSGSDPEYWVQGLLIGEEWLKNRKLV